MVRMEGPGGTLVDLEIDGLVRLTVDELQGARHLRLGKAAFPTPYRCGSFCFRTFALSLDRWATSRK